MTGLEKFYYQHYAIDKEDVGIGTGLMAALESFTFRFLPKGKIEYLNKNHYKVTLEQVANFVHDVFNFEGKQDYGFWSCENKDASFFHGVFDKTYVAMNNFKFNAFREHNKMGNDFLVLSPPKLIDNFRVCF